MVFKACVCCPCDPSVHLSVPSIGFVFICVCLKLSPNLRLVAVTMMHVLLFVLDVSILRECGSARVMAMLVWGALWCGCGEWDMSIWVVHMVQVLCLVQLT